MLKSKYIFLFALIWIVILLVLLPYRGLPWFDEVFMANISHSFLNTGKLFLSLELTNNYQEILSYGPITFFVQSLFFKFFGENIYSARLVNFIFGLIYIFLVCKYLYRKSNNLFLVSILALLIVFDGSIASSLMNGRLDFIAMSSFFFGFYLFSRSSSPKKQEMIFVGLLFSFAYLSTPRIGFYLLPFLFYFIYNIVTNKNRNGLLQQYIILAIFSVVPILLWVFLKFGSVKIYVDYYLENSIINAHFGISTSIIPRYDQVIVFLSLLLLVVYTFYRRLFDKEILFFIGCIVSHLLFIKEVGPYSSMIMPIVYLSIFLLVEKSGLYTHWKPIAKVLLYIYLFSIISISFFRILVVLNSFEHRNPFTYSEELANHISKDKKAKVLANYEYYYMLSSHEHHFTSVEYNRKKIENDKNLILMFDYIVVTNETKEQLFNEFPFLREYKATKFGDIENHSRFSNILPERFKGFNRSYEGWVIDLDNKTDF